MMITNHVNMYTYYLLRLAQQTNKQTEIIQEVVSWEVSKLNHAVMNKKQGDQMQFSVEND